MSKTPRPKRKKSVPRASIARPYNGGQWSTSRFFGFLRSSLRRSSSRWGPVYQAFAEAETGKKINKASGRLAMHYRCACCAGEFPRKNVAADHIIPAGSLTCFEDLPAFAQRLFVEKEGFQVLCDDCHQIKTNQERDEKKTRA